MDEMDGMDGKHMNSIDFVEGISYWLHSLVYKYAHRIFFYVGFESTGMDGWMDG